MKVIHLSDTHIGKPGLQSPLQLITDSLMNNPPADPPDCIVLHTGDLINDGIAEQRQQGLEFLNSLQSAGYQTLLCPGNHDCGGFLGVDSAKLSAFYQTLSSHIFGNKPRQFPVLNQFGNWSLIGLNSNQAEVQLNALGRLGAEGYIGEQQLARLDALITEQRALGQQILVYLHHHPFHFGYSVKVDLGDRHKLVRRLKLFTRRFRRLKDAYTLCQILQDRVTVLLFGHQHAGLVCSPLSAQYGIPVALDAGSSTGDAQFDSRLRYRILDLDTLEISTQLIEKGNPL